MTEHRRKISKEIYDRAKERKGCLTREDYGKVFDDTELMGYGVYGARAYEENGEFFVWFQMGSSCD